jgi:hypothetical protein
MKDSRGRGGKGTNQYQVRGASKQTLPVPVAPQAALYDQLADVPSLPAATRQFTSAEALVSNPATPASLLYIMAHAREWRIRYQLANHPNLPEPVFPILANDGSPMVRSAIAARLDAPAEVLFKLASDPDERVRDAVRRNTYRPSNLFVLR